MKKIKIEGGHKLSGTIKISGMKNSVVALIPAAMLCDESVSIYNVPNISDTHALIEIVNNLGAKTEYNNETLEIDSSNVQNILIEEKYASKLRASYYFMGALLGRYKFVEMYFPGGCKIGARPIDIHLKGFESLGATIEQDGDKFKIYAEKLVGTNIYLDFASVGATINIMLAAVKAEGETVISNAAKEPDIVNIATFLNNMGAQITGAGTSIIKIKGVNRLHKAVIDVIPDRIEAGTYIIAGALLGENLVIDAIIPEHVGALLSKLKEMRTDIKIEQNRVIVNANKTPRATHITSLVYPGFPTDLGQPISVLLTQCLGVSYFEETIFENRFGHIEHLNKMGAKISRGETIVKIEGPTTLVGTEVEATDLRAGATMVLAGLKANGTTYISEIDHILRGYENMCEKLSAVGAKISIVE